MSSRHRTAHYSAQGENRKHHFARTAHQHGPFDRGGVADGDDGGAVNPYRAQHDCGARQRRGGDGTSQRPRPTPPPRRAWHAHRFEANVEPCITATVFRAPRDCTIRRTITTPVGSVLWWTWPASARTRSCSRHCRSSIISPIVALADAIRAPATAPESWCRFLTNFSNARHANAALNCRSRALTASARSFSRSIPSGAWRAKPASNRSYGKKDSACWAGARSRWWRANAVRSHGAASRPFARSLSRVAPTSATSRRWSASSTSSANGHSTRLTRWGSTPPNYSTSARFPR